jgi:hypothetical protein
MAILSARDAERWHALAHQAAEVLEPRLGDREHGNRAILDRGGWRLRELRPSLRMARGAARRLAAHSPLMIRTDVASFYPSVTPAILARSLRRVRAEPIDADLAADLLDRWGSDGYAGLPIGPPASAVLANAVLREVDLALGRLPFLRWVDDYLIGCRTEAETRLALELLDDSLAGIGLRRSEAKTQVEDGGHGIRWPGGASVGR